ncbi:MAG TPA: ABC transporter ATP-binding protein [Anaerolineales bacterium]|nr:ABC transporter ATP-binding protein [Anaerolineales bacterium]
MVETTLPVQPIIEVENLTKRYRNAKENAVDGISFSVGAGEFFTLLGPNGAGKTTTISILTTTLHPTSGVARIAGHDIRRASSAVRQNIGIIFQQPSLDLNLTAEENVRFHAVLYGLYPFRPTFSTMPREYKQQVFELAALLGLENEMGKAVKKFSGGMRRKLEIIRSLLHEPAVIFLDEPTSGLDPVSRRTLWEYLRTVRRERGTTIFLTTHYLDEAEEADQTCILNHGRIVVQGSPQQVKAQLTQSYLLIDAENHGPLREELRRLKIDFTETASFKIDLQGRDVQRIIKAIETPLSSVQTHDPSLEDAYLEIIKEP